MKANHNELLTRYAQKNVVYQVKDTIFWKQITTKKLNLNLLQRCLSSQRYNFLKANHNCASLGIKFDKVVYQVKDTIFWKQITTTQVTLRWLLRCLSSQRYNFLKANHNQSSISQRNEPVVYQVKDTIFWKQITTWPNWVRCLPWLFIKSKIQFFESKSQQNSAVSLTGLVVYQVKDTIFWKQITTKERCNRRVCLLFIKSKIQFFESKSQPYPDNADFINSCLSSQRYNFLKANHNM